MQHSAHQLVVVFPDGAFTAVGIFQPKYWLAHPEISYFPYPEKYFLDRSTQKIFNLILKKKHWSTGSRAYVQ